MMNDQKSQSKRVVIPNPQPKPIKGGGTHTETMIITDENGVETRVHQRQLPEKPG